MTTTSGRRRSPSCLSDLALDRLHAGELSPGSAREARSHLESCPSCRDANAAIEADRDAFRAAPPFLPSPSSPSWRDRWRHLLAPAGALVAAAALLLIVFGQGDEAAVPDVTRTKGGGHSLGFYLKRGDQVLEGIDGQSLRPGDRVRFRYTARAPSHLIVASVDGRDTVSIYYADGDAAAAVEAAEDAALPESVILDDVLGPERIHGFFCERPVSTRDARRAVSKSPSAPALEGCQVETLRWTKVAP